MPDETPEISVIIPTYNRADSILPAVESVLAQTFTAIEVIVVDDASRDTTQDRLSTLSDQRIRIVRHEQNRGAAAARNTGIRAARAPYIAFQDSDDYWQPKKLQIQLSALKSNRSADAAYCSLVRTWDKKTILIPSPSIRIKEGDISEEILFHNYISTQTLLVARGPLESVGGFDESLPCLEDWDLIIRLSETIRFVFVDEPLVNAEVQRDSISRNLEAACIALAHIHEKHMHRYQSHTLANAKFYARRGHYACLAGDAATGRCHFRKCLKRHPLYVPAAALWSLSCCGTDTYRKLVRWKTST